MLCPSRTALTLFLYVCANATTCSSGVSVSLMCALYTVYCQSKEDTKMTEEVARRSDPALRTTSDGMRYVSPDGTVITPRTALLMDRLWVMLCERTEVILRDWDRERPFRILRRSWRKHVVQWYLLGHDHHFRMLPERRPNPKTVLVLNSPEHVHLALVLFGAEHIHVVSPDIPLVPEWMVGAGADVTQACASHYVIRLMKSLRRVGASRFQVSIMRRGTFVRLRFMWLHSLRTVDALCGGPDMASTTVLPKCDAVFNAEKDRGHFLKSKVKNMLLHALSNGSPFVSMFPIRCQILCKTHEPVIVDWTGTKPGSSLVEEVPSEKSSAQCLYWYELKSVRA